MSSYNCSREPAVFARFHHIGFEVDRLEESAHFFRSLGFQETERFQWHRKTIIFLRHPSGLTIELEEKPNGQTGPDVHLAFCVHDVSAMLAHVNQGLLLEAPQRFPNGWTSAFIEGPSGEVIEWMEKRGRTPGRD
jgi:lactoylglutathione lyase